MGIRTSYFLVLHFFKSWIAAIKKKRKNKKGHRSKKKPKGLTEHGKFPLRCV